MGKEAACEARVNGKSDLGKAKLETDDLRFRGTHKVSFPLSLIESTEVRDDWLIVTSLNETLELKLDNKAAAWEKAILFPPTLIDKLGVKSHHLISVLGFSNVDFLGGLQHSRHIEEGARYDYIFISATDPQHLRSLRDLRESLAEKGAIWIVYPKGVKEITELQVITAGRLHGFNDIKVCRFSQTHTGLKFVRR